MPVIFVVAEDWMLRAGIRAELREHGIKALGMETASEVARAIASGEAPSVIILDADATAAADSGLQQLARRVPTIVIASRTASAPFDFAINVLFRPVQIKDVTAAALELVKGGSA